MLQRPDGSHLDQSTLGKGPELGGTPQRKAESISDSSFPETNFPGNKLKSFVPCLPTQLWEQISGDSLP